MALGHWLKDYIGPNSANNGGGTVEVSKIKIATVRGGGNKLAKWDTSGTTGVAKDSQTWEVAGGGSFDDGKTLAEILDGKRIVSLAYDIQNEGDNVWHVKGAFVKVGDSSLESKNILIAQFDPEASASTQITFFANGFGDTVPNGKAIDIYAICI